MFANSFIIQVKPQQQKRIIEPNQKIPILSTECQCFWQRNPLAPNHHMLILVQLLNLQIFADWSLQMINNINNLFKRSTLQSYRDILGNKPHWVQQYYCKEAQQDFSLLLYFILSLDRCPQKVQNLTVTAKRIKTGRQQLNSANI